MKLAEAIKLKPSPNQGTNGSCGAYRCRQKAFHEIEGIGLCHIHFGEAIHRMPEPEAPTEIELNEEAITDYVGEQLVDIEGFSQMITDLMELEEPTREDTLQASVIANHCHTVFNSVEGRRKESTSMLLEKKREIDSYFKPLTGLLKEVKDTLKDKMLGWHENNLNKVRAGEMAITDDPGLPLGTSERKKYKIVVADPSELHPKFQRTEPDYGAIEHYLKSTNYTDMPVGVEVEVERSLTLKPGDLE